MGNTSQFEIWTALLRLRVYIKPHDLLEFLYRRYMETWEIDYDDFDEELAKNTEDEDSDADTDQNEDDWTGEGIITGESLLSVISSGNKNKCDIGGTSYLMQVKYD